MENTEFNIETYLNSLPDDVEIIDLSYKNLTYIPSLKRFTKLRRLDCYHNNLTALPELNHNLDTLSCNNNQLTALPKLNEKLRSLNCNDNQLTTLPEINENLTLLWCDNN